MDCSITENYFAEKIRMTRAAESKYGMCKIDCRKCPLYPTNNGTSENLSCTSIEKRYPKKRFQSCKDGVMNTNRRLI